MQNAMFQIMYSMFKGYDKELASKFLNFSKKVPKNDKESKLLCNAVLNMMHDFAELHNKKIKGVLKANERTYINPIVMKERRD